MKALLLSQLASLSLFVNLVNSHYEDELKYNDPYSNINLNQKTNSRRLFSSAKDEEIDSTLNGDVEFDDKKQPPQFVSHAEFADEGLFVDEVENYNFKYGNFTRQQELKRYVQNLENLERKHVHTEHSGIHSYPVTQDPKTGRYVRDEAAAKIQREKAQQDLSKIENEIRIIVREILQTKHANFQYSSPGVSTGPHCKTYPNLIERILSEEKSTCKKH